MMTPTQVALHLGGARVKIFTEKADIAAEKAVYTLRVSEQMAKVAREACEKDKIEAENAAYAATKVAKEAKNIARATTNRMNAARRTLEALMAEVQRPPLRIAARSVPFVQELDDTESVANDFSSLQITAEGDFHLTPLDSAQLSSDSGSAVGAGTIALDTQAGAALIGVENSYSAPPPSAEG